MTSTDGITWTSRTSPVDNSKTPPENSWRSVTYADGVFVAVSQTGTGNRVMTSGQIGLAARVAAAQAEAARVAAAQAEAARKAKEQKELTEILSLIPELGKLSLNIGETSKALTGTKCVKKKQIKYIFKGEKCPKGFAKRK
jgi:hypothetical protein